MEDSSVTWGEAFNEGCIGSGAYSDETQDTIDDCKQLCVDQVSSRYLLSTSILWTSKKIAFRPPPHFPQYFEETYFFCQSQIR